MRKILARLLIIVVLILAMPSATFAARQLDPGPTSTPSAPSQVPAAPAQIPHRPEVPPMSKVWRVMPVGNSITMGQDADLVGSLDLLAPGAIDTWKALWVGYRREFSERAIAAGYQIEMVGSQTNGCQFFPQCHHEGHGAWQTSNIDLEIAGWIAAQHPDVILLHTGTVDAVNESLHAGASDRIAALLRHIYTIDPNLIIIMATIPPIADNLTGPGSNVSVNQINAALLGIVSAQQTAGQRIILVRPSLSLADLSDGIHANVRGYHKIAEAFLGGLVEMLPVPPTTPVDPCSLSQRIALTTVPATADRLRVTVTAKGQGNTLQSIAFGAHLTADIESLTQSGTVASFTVHRRVPGPMHVPFTVTDACGPWQTFVGGGAASFLQGRPAP